MLAFYNSFLKIELNGDTEKMIILRAVYKPSMRSDLPRILESLAGFTH